MKIALCGAGSTGKTTLVAYLLSDPRIECLQLKSIDVNARLLIDSMGHRNIDLMTSFELQCFQRKYVSTKIQLERNETNYITQRSFVDSAAYWIVRDAVDEPSSFKEPFVEKCKSLTKLYDGHIFLPFGQIPLEHDGYRSNDIEQFYRVSNAIESYLQLWNIDYCHIDTGNMNDRIEQAIEYILSVERRVENV